MNSAQIPVVLGLAVIVAGCATSSAVPPASGTGPCTAAAAQHLVGEMATQNLASTAMQVSGAREFRWIPEGSAVTMDYRPTRLNIEFDSNSTITAIRCG